MDEEHILSDKEWLLKLASLLEGEGMEAGPVQLAEEFAQMIAHRLRAIADKMELADEQVLLRYRRRPEVYGLEGEETDG